MEIDAINPMYESVPNSLYISSNSPVAAEEENIITGVTATSKIYGHENSSGPANIHGIKSGTSKVGGSFTITTTKEVTKVTVVAHAWNNTASGVSINGSASQNCTKAGTTLTFLIEGSTTLTFSFTNRTVVTSITFEA